MSGKNAGGSPGFGSLAGMLDSMEFLRKAWSSFSLPTNLAPTVDPEEIDRRFHPAAYFLRPGFHARLIDLLRGDPGWVEAYRDGTAAIFVRTGPPVAERLAGPS